MAALVRMSPARRKEALWFYVCIAPWLIGFLGLQLGPMIASLVFSFTRYNITQPMEFLGLANYVRALSGKDVLFWHALKITVTYAAVTVPLRLILGFVLALLLNHDIPGVSFWRTLYYLPSVLTGVAVAVLWMLIFRPNFGVLNHLLSIVGIEGPAWLYDKHWALPALMIMSMWGVGGGMVIYLAGLQGIPTALYEAATIDGATVWHKLLHVTLPLMSPVIFFNLVRGMIGTFQVFTSAYVMTAGGPQNATFFYSLHLYNSAFLQMRMGYASMLAWVLFAIILVFTLLTVRSSAAWVYYEGELKRG
jgi:multiple sugar transport system permease protein